MPTECGRARSAAEQSAAQRRQRVILGTPGAEAAATVPGDAGATREGPAAERGPAEPKARQARREAEPAAAIPRAASEASGGKQHAHASSDGERIEGRGNYLLNADI